MTARQLADFLCRPELESAWRSRRDDDRRCDVRAGFAGYPWVDEGYEFMAKATDPRGPNMDQPEGALSVVNRQLEGGDPAGLRPWPSVGDWPYVIVLASPAELAFAHYCEGDLAVEFYDDQDAYTTEKRRLLETMRCP